jgi:hypothetical protein
LISTRVDGFTSFILRAKPPGDQRGSRAGQESSRQETRPQQACRRSPPSLTTRLTIPVNSLSFHLAIAPSVNFGGTIHLTGALQAGLSLRVLVKDDSDTKRTAIARNASRYLFTKFFIGGGDSLAGPSNVDRITVSCSDAERGIPVGLKSPSSPCRASRVQSNFSHPALRKWPA